MILRKITEDIFVIDGLLDETECIHFIELGERAGYEAATIETEKGAKLVESVRNNNRVIYTDAALAHDIWKRAQPYYPATIGNSQAVGLNEMFRFYRYAPGQRFKMHTDQSFIRNDREASYYTLMIYLNDDYTGGETIFNGYTTIPKQGSCLIFLHSLPHEGSEVTKGVKYVLRTDIMYKLDGRE